MPVMKKKNNNNNNNFRMTALSQLYVAPYNLYVYGRTIPVLLPGALRFLFL